MSLELNQGRRDAVAIGTLLMESNLAAKAELYGIARELMVDGTPRVHNALVAIADLWLDTVRAHFTRCPCGKSEDEHVRSVLVRLGSALLDA